MKGPNDTKKTDKTTTLRYVSLNTLRAVRSTPINFKVPTKRGLQDKIYGIDEICQHYLNKNSNSPNS